MGPWTVDPRRQALRSQNLGPWDPRLGTLGTRTWDPGPKTTVPKIPIKKETPAQIFSCNLSKTFKSTFFT